jgi:predicted Zn-dependent protease
VARTLWRLGRRPQALGAWRDAVRVAPQLRPSALAELDRSGARPSELASLAAGGAADPLATARYLLPKKAEPEVLALIETAKDLRAPVGEVDLLRVDLLLTLDHVAEAKRLLDERWAGMSNDPRAHATRSIVEERLGDPGAALRTVRAGLDRDPGDLALAHRQLELVRRQKLWRDLDAALATLRASQRARGVAPVEYHLTAGAAYLDRGSFGRARTEYREAVELSPNNPNLWRLLGEASERVEDRAAAAEAYARALELLGHDEPALRAALDRTKR